MDKKQGIFNLAFRYTRALSRWIKAGRPVRTEEEIRRVFKTYCESCEAYEEGRCRYCGCHVNLLNLATLNKIAMATEECPLDKWGEKQ
jgi:hypothetical protein